MPVCLAGMHRSGTSMIARLLHLCGLYLGPENELIPPALDNPEGFWENLQFVHLNDAILQHLQGTWNVPPSADTGWENRPEIAALRPKATDLIRQFDAHAPWGWKDPRNSVTLPFWQSLMPDVKMLLCVRHPLEVVQSLEWRGYQSSVSAWDLWLTYNERALAGVAPTNRVVTHYDAYFHDTPAELRRVLGLLDMSASAATIAAGCAAVARSLRHNRAREAALRPIPGKVMQLYERLCADAGPVFQAAAQSKSAAEASALERVQSALAPTGSLRERAWRMGRFAYKLWRDEGFVFVARKAARKVGRLFVRAA